MNKMKSCKIMKQQNKKTTKRGNGNGEKGKIAKC